MRFCQVISPKPRRAVVVWRPGPEDDRASLLNRRDEGVLMSFATRKRRITGREANRMQTSRASSDGRHRSGSARTVEVAGPQPFAVEVQRRDAVAIVQPRGELDLVTVETLRAALDGIETPSAWSSICAACPSWTPRVCSCWWRSPARAARRIAADSRGAHGSGDRAIQLCGLDQELPFVAAVDAAPGESTSGPRGDK